MERGEGLQDGGERSRKEGVGGDEFRGASPKGAGDARAPKEGLSAEEQLTHDYDAAVSAGLVPPMDPKVAAQECFEGGWFGHPTARQEPILALLSPRGGRRVES
jgi:hypothetical protein